MKRKAFALAIAVLLAALSVAGCSQSKTGLSGLFGQTTDGAVSPATSSSSLFPTVTMQLTPTATAEQTQAPLPSQTMVAPTAPVDFDSEQALAYFLDVAVESDNHIKRWAVPIKVQIKGDYTQEDYDTVVGQLDMFNDVGGIPAITIVTKGANFFVTFAPMDKMASVVTGYNEDSWYYCHYWWNDKYQLTKYEVAIVSDVSSQAERNYMILRSLSIGLGMFQKVPTYSDSIFYDKWSELQRLADIDYFIIHMLYLPEIKPGMTRKQAEAALVS